ncbi:hypothetical protein SAMN06297468_1627 [Altererythrobacter xiamenensis]|uniref:Uncharacterized protein n=1 Tax=Altererythrobacter xiamenensis TaxID=1316679 RepID=A0A1Y6F3F2_9SPHN|nr:hypothetical protein SAMN06297468_1627 [Altererythrobacter xiamenensis]
MVPESKAVSLSSLPLLMWYTKVDNYSIDDRASNFRTFSFHCNSHRIAAVGMSGLHSAGAPVRPERA